MSKFSANVARTPETAEFYDVVIVGAGIAGIGSAYHLKTGLPGKSFALFDEQLGFGGTWRTHKYPGVRSDSDLHTFGYRFKPWRGTPIATADEILKYMKEVIVENDLERHIHFGHRVVTARWSSTQAQWDLEIEDLGSGKRRSVATRFLWMCQGYYRHDKGYTPEWPGMADFNGQVVHPQEWPENLDFTGKKVVVIGSGATAATLIPSMTDRAEHVTMVQRSPGYFTPGRNRNELAETLRALDIDPAWIHEIVRRSILSEGAKRTKAILANPDNARTELLKALEGHLDQETIAKHFSPSYAPWNQRICFVPDGDFFKAMNAGKATVATGEIERFTEAGLLMASGETIEADIIVTATGFDLLTMGGAQFYIDNHPLDFADTVTYRGMMFTGVPNLVWVFGYFRASWTLRADLVGDFVIRLLRYMDDQSLSKVEVQLGAEESGMELRPFVEPSDFNPGYLQRGMHKMPRSLPVPEWRHSQNYAQDAEAFPAIAVEQAPFAYC